MDLTNKNKPCEVCGDIGYDDVISVCSQCKDTHEHVYCMKIFYDGDPEKWVCQECQTPSQKPLPSPVLSKPIEVSKINFRLKRPVLKSKVRYLTPEEVMGLESGAPKTKFSPSKIHKKDDNGFKRLPPKISLKPNPRAGPPAIRKPVKPGSIPRSSSDEKWLAAVRAKSMTHTQHAWNDSTVNMGWSSRSAPSYNGTEQKVTGEGPVKHVCQGTISEPIPSEEIHKTSTEKGNKEQFVKHLGTTSSEKEPQCHPSDALTRPSPFSELQELILEKCGNNVCANTKQKDTDAESTESSKVAVNLKKSLPNHPAESPTWRGKFNVTSNVLSSGFYDEIIAHLPSKVHRKVYELCKQLPKMLQFGLLPRSSLWAELFDEYIPGAIDIGLYFLPSNSCEEMYFSLVERLDECDMLLKSCVNGVELLIFSSKKLENGCQQIDGRHFLWGVFRSCEDKDTSAGIPTRIDDQTCRMEEDMEVDMIGRQEMDNADKVVAKLAQTVSDATPEFSPVKVKIEIREGNVARGLSSLIEHELSFERELQRRFDSFDALIKGESIQDVKLEK